MDVSQADVVEALLDEIRQLQFRVATQAAAIKMLQQDNAALRQPQPTE